MDTTLILILSTAALGLGFSLCLALAIQFRIKLSQTRRKYGPIIDADQAVAELRKQAETQSASIEKLRADYAQKRSMLDALIKHAAIYDETIELAELGFYRPHFDFDTSERFKQKIDTVRRQQKDMVRDKTAVVCRTEWTVEGSKAKGKTMVNRALRLTARAFNNECDAAIGNVRWNNVDRMEARVTKAFEAINKLNESQTIEISPHYLQLKLDELRLTHEYHDKKQQEKEEQAELRRQIKEEERLEREAEAAAKEEAKYQKLLAKAREAASKALGPELDQLQSQLADLEGQLAEAQAKNERAKSMAEQTRRGHVYIISNIGSFGDNVYKIGMTRRLDPMDRVKELGDASVPFVFDVHGIIFSEDAPGMERELHHAFADQRVNLVNNRKEFFKVSLAEIEERVRRLDPNAEIYETAEAREYRESLAIRQRRSEEIAAKPAETFPASI